MADAGYLELEHGTEPGSPSTGFHKVYVDTADGKLKKKDSLGNVAIYENTATAVTSVFGRTGAVVAVGGDYTASQVTNTPAGNISSVTVQAALNELDTEKVDVSHVGSGGASHAAATTSVNGFMSAADKTKLDGITAGATPGLNQLTGEVLAGPGTGSQAATIPNAVIIAKVLTGLVEAYGQVISTDSILQAFQKLAYSGGLQPQNINEDFTVPDNWTLIRSVTNLGTGVTIDLGSNSILEMI